jgi:multiple sugar transport system permease protein
MAADAHTEGKSTFWYRRTVQRRLTKIIAYVCAISLSVVFLLPFYWMVSTAFKQPALIYKDPPVWIPPVLTLDNFRLGLQLLLPSFQKLFANSTIITLLTIAGTLLSSSLVGFAFATLPARGKPVLFALLLSTLMIPYSVTLLPQFIIFSRLGWNNTWLPLIVPYFFTSPFYVFMFRQFFASIPRDLFDCAELDGCSPLGLYWHIVLPLSRAVFATATIFSFLASWNDLLNPLIYLSDMRKFTLTLGLANFQGSAITPQVQLQYLMPMALLALIPVLIIFFFVQRYFVQGIVTTGMKG